MAYGRRMQVLVAPMDIGAVFHGCIALQRRRAIHPMDMEAHEYAQ
jgi:hypothetical protein